MKAGIGFEKAVTPDVSCDIDELGDMLIAELGASVEKELQQAKVGAKDGGLVIGISILGVTLASINTIISVINLWRSTQNRYSVTIKDGDYSISVSSMTKNDIDKVFERLRVKNSNLLLKISSNE